MSLPESLVERAIRERREALDEAARLRDALLDAYRTMDAACTWAAGETLGVKTLADADRHVKGFDALLDGTVRAGIAAGVLRGDIMRDVDNNPRKPT